MPQHDGIIASCRNQIRVLLLDDHIMFREGIRRLINAEPDMEIAVTCGSVGEALIAVACGSIDLVLLDLDLGQEQGSAFLLRAREIGFRGPILILTAGVSLKDEAVLNQHNVSGLVLKQASAAALVGAIRDAVAGIAAARTSEAVPISSPVVSRLILSARELEVLRSILAGLINKEIAARTGLSESSVKAVLQRLFERAGVRSRSQLVRIALEQYSDQL